MRSITYILLATALLAASSTAQPANDDCPLAVTIVDGVNGVFTNVGATTSAPGWPCATGGNDVWFTYTATCTGPVSFNTCSTNTSYDTCIEIFNADCTNLLSIVCNDDSCGLQSAAATSAMAGDVFNVRVGGFSSATGNFELNVGCSGATANDECANAIPLIAGFNGLFNTQSATTSSPGWPCAGGGNDVWFSFTPICDGNYEFNTCTGATYDTAIELFGGTCAALSPIACNDDFCGLQSGIQAALVSGTTYYLRVGGYNGARGAFNVDVTRQGGGGSFSTLFANCGTTSMTTAGNPDIGTTISYSIAPAQGVAIIWMGAVQLGTPLCTSPTTCTLGTTIDFIQVTDTLTGVIPCDPTLVGATFYTQGADVGALGGCGSGILGVPFELSETVATNVGS